MVRATAGHSPEISTLRILFESISNIAEVCTNFCVPFKPPELMKHPVLILLSLLVPSLSAPKIFNPQCVFSYQSITVGETVH